ncbi:hypothetical protein F511_41135 [Dorcoceras hygrometricum]|uniref:Uncharacterized protein n=1 Tax=Dorcoceras hygrometricum TaxID=472368 RepID=A0A2Z7ALK7_9LAMI|nr:hypothetical protein F511_41135 [Dorcoceras hygrometricum]
MKRRRAKESADGLALMTSSVTSSYSADGLREQSQDISSWTIRCKQQHIQSTKISAEDEFSRSDKSTAKQLTIYESWMSTAELNSNGENDKKPAKEKDTNLTSAASWTRFSSVPEGMYSFQPPQMPQSSSHQRFKPRGKQFKKRSSSSSSGSDRSGGGSSRAEICGQCGECVLSGDSVLIFRSRRDRLEVLCVVLITLLNPRDQDFRSRRHPGSEGLLNLGTRDISGLRGTLVRQPASSPFLWRSSVAYAIFLKLIGSIMIGNRPRSSILRLPFLPLREITLEDFDEYRRCRHPVTELSSK